MTIHRIASAKLVQIEQKDKFLFGFFEMQPNFDLEQGQRYDNSMDVARDNNMFNNIKTKKSMKTRIIKPFQYVLSDKNCMPQEGCVLVSMQGHRRFQDYYVCMPAKGVWTRTANTHRYGPFKNEIFIDGQFVGATRMDRVENVKKLYDAGCIDEARQYALGYMFWRETSLGGNHINKRKEAARISHELCEVSGKAGHDARQYIRKQILRGHSNL